MGIIKAQIKNKGEVSWEHEMQAEVPIVNIEVPDNLGDFSKIQSVSANSCIYCGSNEQLSDEHVLAYALGGRVEIKNGSCEVCRKITHGFETAVLRGPFQFARYKQNMPSRTKYKDVPKTVSFIADIDGEIKNVILPRDEVPVLLAFPMFEEPNYMMGGESRLRINGSVIGSYGIDPKEFSKKYKINNYQFTSEYKDIVAFARLIAKTAFAFVHMNNQLHRVVDFSGLVKSFMYAPDEIGRYVGTVPGHFVSLPGAVHLMGFGERIYNEEKVLFVKIQFFAASGAPTYIVIIGSLRDGNSPE